MPCTRFDTVVFDFDGTLVQSAGAKRQAFFDVFPSRFAPSVQAVLDAHPDLSRFAVIPMMMQDIARRGLPVEVLDADRLAEAYGTCARRLVANAPDMPGAGDVLARMAGTAAVYIASVTPEADLRALVASRAWRKHITAMFGHPVPKARAIAMLLERQALPPHRLLMVGDGDGDEQAAKANGCVFHRVRGPDDLMAVPEL